MAHSSTHGPAHYKRGKIEVWDFIRDQDLNYHLGNAIKYVCRAGYKDNKIEDLKKAIHYLQNELDHTDINGSGGAIPFSLQSIDDWDWD
jgi:predicted Zn-dependent protease